MLVRRVVVSMTSRSIFRLNRPLKMLSSRAPDAPMAAASVGAAMPKKMEPSTAIIRNSGGTSTLLTRIRSSRREIEARSSGGMGGAACGRKNDTPSK